MNIRISDTIRTLGIFTALALLSPASHAETHTAQPADNASSKSELILPAEERARSLDYPIRYVFTYQLIGLTYLNALDRDITNFDTFSLDTFKEGFSRAPEQDGDGAFWNYIMHPLWGSETYLRARSQNYAWWESFLFSTASSIVWEYGMENFVTHPSTPDLIITPLAGSLLGELRFRLKKRILKSDYKYRNTYLVLVDPLQSFTEFVGRRFGKNWEEPAYSERQAPQRFSHLDVSPTISAQGKLGMRVQYQVRF